MAISEGALAPDFTLQSSDGPVTLSKLRGKKVVLYFYPKDNTSGCTQEACDFRDSLSRLKGHGAVVLGVSKDSLQSHGKFADKYSLPFPLLSDPDNAVAKQYGAYGKKMMYGKPVVGTIRSTMLIDEKGKLEKIWSPVRVAGHVDAVLAALDGEGAAPAKAKPAKKPARKPVKRASR